MFDRSDLENALPMLERMRGNITRTATITQAEIDVIAQQVLVPLFQTQGVPITAQHTKTGWLLTITYPDADSTTPSVQPLPTAST